MSLISNAIAPDAVPDHEFHRRRAEIEMEKALAARQPSVSLLHLELAKIHRQRREQIVAEDRERRLGDQAPRIFRTDKEG
jgi:hypothetical protein